MNVGINRSRFSLRLRCGATLLCSIVASIVFCHAHAADSSAVSRARMAIDAGNRGSAVAMLEERIAAEPGDAEARFLLARVLSWLERWAESLQQYEALLADDPDSVDYLYGKGQVLVWSGHPEEALPILERARTQAPAYESIWQLESQALLAAGDEVHRKRAMALSEEARRRFPDSVWPLWETASPSTHEIDRRPVYANEFEAGISYETLDSGQSDWHSIYVEGSHRLDDRKSIYGVARSTERFDQTDVELIAGGYLPVTDNWTTVLEGSVAPDADVLPRWSASGQLQRPLRNGFGLQVGLRHSRYEDDYTNLASVTGDRYWGNYYAGYTLYAGRLQGAGTNLSHQVRLDRYYGDRNRVGLLVSVGDETESVGSGQFVTDTTTTFIVNGRHWFMPLWAISWEMIWHDQGDAYTRGGVRVGLRRQF